MHQAREAFTTPWVYWIGLLLLCAPYLQGAVVKTLDFRAATSEMRGYGLPMPGPLAAAVILLEAGASVMVLAGIHRGLAALVLAAFTAAASGLADRFWMLVGVQRFAAANAFFEHAALVGGWLLVAWQDLALSGVG